MSKLNICILGGSGFIGHHIAARLAADQHNVVIVSRRSQRCRDLLVLPTVQVVQGNVHHPVFLRQRFKGMDAVINLVGILNEKGHKGAGFVKAHVELARQVVEACGQVGVPRLLHMSALNASTDAPSHYLRTKAEAENLVHNASILDFHVTSFRPSVVFGREDSFINRFAQLLKFSPYIFPLACGKARFQPVYVGDVAAAFVNALENHRTFGQRFDLCGPKVYTLHELVAYVARQLGLRTKIIDLNNVLSRLQAALLEYAPGKPFSVDNYHSLQVDSVCRRQFSPVFKMEPTSLESIVPHYIGRSATMSRLDALRSVHH